MLDGRVVLQTRVAGLEKCLSIITDKAYIADKRFECCDNNMINAASQLQQ